MNNHSGSPIFREKSYGSNGLNRELHEPGLHGSGDKIGALVTYIINYLANDLGQVR